MRSEITSLLKARNTLLWINTREEQRVEREIIQAAADAKYPVRLWDCFGGIAEASGKVLDASAVAPVGDMPASILSRVRDDKSRCVYVLRDFHAFVRDPFTQRALRSLARTLQSAPATEARTMIVLAPTSDIPPELQACATIVEWAMPGRDDLAKLLDDTIKALPAELQATVAPNGTRERAVDAALGLTVEEASNCFAKSLVSTRTIDPAIIAGEKKRVIARGKGVTWEDPDPRGLDAVGGLDQIKAWLTQRKSAFSARARAYGLTPPKGVFLVGLPGTGKTLVSRCVAAAWGLPLLSLDLNGLQSKYVGESQTNLRATLKLLETVAPCVVRVDEIEKALAGSQGGGDGGVAADALGTFLSWMQERKAAVFVIATANDVRSLPPELLRKGRFDETFFVDLPTRVERIEVVKAALAANGRGAVTIDHAAVADVTEGFSGAEIAALIPDAMFVGFDDGEREITTADIVAAAKRVVPLSKTAATKITDLREWAKEKARPASTPEIERGAGTGRALQLD
jgi:SpoVK/Ycf46/Vps4 family AAA+-type ATPase